MGYDLHITRRNDWSDEGSDIFLSEWLAYLEASPDMRLDGNAEATTNTGEILRVEAPGIAVWTKYSQNGVDGNWAWFHHSNGNVVVKNPDAEIRRQMFVVAQHFGACVQGDDGELYDELGNIKGSINTGQR